MPLPSVYSRLGLDVLMNVEIREENGRRGVFLAEDVADAVSASSNIVASIPLASTLSCQSLIDNSPEIGELVTFAGAGSLDDDSILALFLLILRFHSVPTDSPSFVFAEPFVDFVQSFPASYSSSIFFSESSISHMFIRNTTLGNLTSRIKHQVLQDYGALQSLLLRFSRIHPGNFFPLELDLQEYVWGLWSIYSRSADVEIPGSDGGIGGRKRLLVPFLDMFNHHSSTSQVSHCFSPEGQGAGAGSVVIKTVAGSPPLLAHSEICLNYGKLSNTKFALFYGFCDEENEFNCTQIHVPLARDDVLFERKVLCMRNVFPDTGWNSDEPIALTRGGNVPDRLMSVLRILPLDDKALEALEEIIGRKEGGMESGIPFISLENEESALMALESSLFAMSQQVAIDLMEGKSNQPTRTSPSPRTNQPQMLTPPYPTPPHPPQPASLRSPRRYAAVLRTDRRKEGVRGGLLHGSSVCGK